MRQKILAIFLFGFILRLSVMPLSFHPDVKGHYLGAWLIQNFGQFLSLYDYISRLPRDHPMVVIYRDDFFVYQPLTYWLHALWLAIASPLIPWQIYPDFELNTPLAQASPQFPLLLLLLKIPYLLADVLLFLLLQKLLPSRRFLASVLWAFNLPLIHSAFLMGQFDVFLVLGIAAAYYFSSLARPLPAAVSLALAAGFKPFPLLLLPFLPGNWLKNTLLGIAIFGLFISPYLLSSPGYRMYALLAQHTDKMWHAKIPVSGSQYLPLFMILYGLLFWLRHHRPNHFPLVIWLMSPLLIFYGLTHFHPQWFSWVSPLLIICAVLYPRLCLQLLALVLCYLLVLFSFDASLHAGLFGHNLDLSDILTDKHLSLIRGFLMATALSLLVIPDSSKPK